MIKQCQQIFNKLLTTEYVFVLGRKGQSETIVLNFDTTDFYHIVGLQYLEDLPQLQGARDRVYQRLKDGATLLDAVRKSPHYNKIVQERMTPFLKIVSLLESDNLVFRFNRRAARHSVFSRLRFDYMFEATDPESGKTICIFLRRRSDEDNQYTLTTIFYKGHIDFSAGNTHWIVLKTDRIDNLNGTVENLYTRPSYQATSR